MTLSQAKQLDERITHSVSQRRYNLLLSLKRSSLCSYKGTGGAMARFFHLQIRAWFSLIELPLFCVVSQYVDKRTLSQREIREEDQLKSLREQKSS